MADEDKTVESKNNFVKRRAGHKSACTKAVEKLKIELAFDSPEPAEVFARIKAINDQLIKIDGYSASIQDLIVDSIEFDSEIEQESEFKVAVAKEIYKAEQFMNADQESRANSIKSDSNKGIGAGVVGITLPVIKLPVFDNTCAGWQEFWDAFSAAVESRDDLQDIQKLIYLRGQLDGEALQLVKYLPLEKKSYRLAIDTLKQAFFNKLLVSFELVKALDNIKSIKHTQEGLREFRAEFEALIGSIENLNYKIKGHEGAEMIVTALMLTRMPKSLLDSLLRSDKDRITTLDGFRHGINLEIELLVSEGIGTDRNPRKKEEKRTTFDDRSSVGASRYSSPCKNTTITDSFHLGSKLAKTSKTNLKNRACAFCNNTYHSSTLCKTYSTLEARQERLKALNKCCRCMRKYPHENGNCGSLKCMCCEGPHVMPVCPHKIKTLNDTNDVAVNELNSEVLGTNTNVCTTSAASVVHSSENVILPFLLVPIKSDLYSAQNGYCNVSTLLDQGSQRTFILRKTAEKLNLKSIGFQKISISTISGKEPEKEFEVVQIPLIRENYEIIITGIVVEELPKQKYTLGVVEKMNFMQTQKFMAWSSISKDGQVRFEMLVGLDHYWDIVNTSQNVIFKDGVHLLPTYYGYVLTGRVGPQLPLQQNRMSSCYSNMASVINTEIEL